ncbi:MAG: ATPase [Modestobacter sp.]|nr:ATPase [Modestobacter sp.]
MEYQVTGVSYRAELPLEFDPLPSAAARPELADAGKLVRRGVRAVVGAAWADDRVTLTSLLLDHLGTAALGWTWSRRPGPGTSTSTCRPDWRPGLADAGRTWQLVGVVGLQHRPFGLGGLLSAGRQAHDPYGPRPGPGRCSRPWWSSRTPT